MHKIILVAGFINMPKRKKLEVHSEQKFVRVTFSNLAILSNRPNNDYYSFTNTNRDIEAYNDHLKVNVFAVIKDQYERNEEKAIDILDGGCGTGAAVAEILTKHGDFINSAVGISKDYYTKIKLVLTDFPEKFVFYHGRLQDVLQDQPRYNLILDVWGAYTYSLDKVDVLKKYYYSLKSSGAAYIYDGSAHHSITQIQLEENHESEPFCKIMCRMYPRHFHIMGAYTLVMRRSTPDFPLKGEFLYSYKDKHITAPNYKEKTVDELEIGCALVHTQISIKRAKLTS